MSEQKEKKPRLQFVTQAFGYEQHKSAFKSIGSTMKSLFSRSRPGVNETFEEAVKRQNLTEADLQARIKFLRWCCILYSVLSLGIFVFGVMRLFHHIGDAILLMGLSGVVAVLAYKQSFWIFQIKQRRLGCTFKEWWRGESGS